MPKARTTIGFSRHESPPDPDPGRRQNLGGHAVTILGLRRLGPRMSPFVEAPLRKRQTVRPAGGSAFAPLDSTPHYFRSHGGVWELGQTSAYCSPGPRRERSASP